ncbi:NAD-dependent epimerase/dehydratase family protein [Candidatus Micrarchaeota archaeon]|nr:NAD-dependent epimerase/dehydratase family protein [Candidatus Micrarchaeota archaeon]
MVMLVTGGTGFLGNRLVKRLIERGENVRVATRKGIAINGAEVLRGDLSDPSFVNRAVRGADGVFHLATNSDHFASRHDHNGAGETAWARNVLAAAEKEGAKAVHMSSAAVKARNKTNYSLAKEEAEKVAVEFGKSFAVPIIRASLIYDQNVLRKLARASWLPFPYKRQRIHLAYRETVVDALLGAMRNGKSKVYEVGDRAPVLLTDFYRALAHPRPMLWIPPQAVWLGIAAAYPVGWAARLAGVRPPITPSFIRYAFEHRDLDTRLAEKELGYEPVDTLDMVHAFKQGRLS